MNTIATTHSENLPQIADQANREHGAALKAATTALKHAMECGRLLIEAKAGIGHGSWSDWLGTNFDGSTRTAQAWMRLYRNRHRLESKAQSSADLSIDGALKLLAERPVEQQVDVESREVPPPPLPYTVADLNHQIDVLRDVVNDPDTDPDQRVNALCRINEIKHDELPIAPRSSDEARRLQKALHRQMGGGA